MSQSGVVTPFIVALLFGCAIAFPGSSAHADDAAIRQARAEYQAGQRLYKLGRFDEALARFEAAFLAKPDPAFLFNIGQCNRLMGRRDEALRAYRNYLKEWSAAPNRPEVESFITELEKARPAEPKPAEAPVNPVVVEKPPEPEKKRMPRWGWALVGAGGVVIVGAAVAVGVVLGTQPAAPESTLGNMGATFQ